jgi:nucleoid-associated protein YgaU
MCCVFATVLGLMLGAAPAVAVLGSPSQPSALTTGAAAAVAYAKAQIGKPYRYGADGPSSYDCSGLTMTAWLHGGVQLPHNAAMQYRATQRIGRASLAPGDLIFRYQGISHVSLYIGGGKQVSATYTGSTVKVQDAFYGDIVGYGRVRGGGGVQQVAERAPPRPRLHHQRPAAAHRAATRPHSRPVGRGVGKTVIVRSGDTLWGFAGARWPEVARANRLRDPNLIFPGQRLWLQGAPAVAADPPTLPSRKPRHAATSPRHQRAQRVATGTVWDRLAQCESSGNWSISTGNGFYGGLQFAIPSWHAAGGTGMPQDASREEQIRVAQNLQQAQGWGAWPACSAKLGLR